MHNLTRPYLAATVRLRGRRFLLLRLVELGLTAIGQHTQVGT